MSPQLIDFPILIWYSFGSLSVCFHLERFELDSSTGLCSCLNRSSLCDCMRSKIVLCLLSLQAFNSACGSLSAVIQLTFHTSKENSVILKPRAVGREIMCSVFLCYYPDQASQTRPQYYLSPAIDVFIFFISS